jgi:indole-3-glycerol phosphate synthase
MPVISEIKVRSPKEGDLLRGRAPEDLAAAMATTPIAGLSVVTDLIHFGGDTDIIRAIRPLVPVPILRKDFTHSERDLDETVDAGADAILLTVCLLDDEPLARLHAAAHERGLETLVEVHDDKDVGRVVELGLRPDVLGVNNRDIQIGETDDGDVTLTERLLPSLPPGSVLLSESAIAGPDDARRARAAGADAVLVGTAILRAPDLAEAIRALVEVGWPEPPA